MGGETFPQCLNNHMDLKKAVIYTKYHQFLSIEHKSNDDMTMLFTHFSKQDE